MLSGAAPFSERTGESTVEISWLHQASNPERSITKEAKFRCAYEPPSLSRLVRIYTQAKSESLPSTCGEPSVALAWQPCF